MPSAVTDFIVVNTCGAIFVGRDVIAIAYRAAFAAIALDGSRFCAEMMKATDLFATGD